MAPTHKGTGRAPVSTSTIAGRLRNHLRASAVGYMALFVALSGTAYSINGSLPGKNTVGSADIINGEVKSPDVGTNQIRSADVRNDDLAGGGLMSEDIANDGITGADIAFGSLGSADVANGTLTGDDLSDGTITGGEIDEATLGKVGSARVADSGGSGRYAFEGTCDPESEAFVACAYVDPMTLPVPGRALVIATIEAATEEGSDNMIGTCRMSVDGNVYNSTFRYFDEDDSGGSDDTIDHATITAVTDPLPAGNHIVGVHCNQSEHEGAIWYPAVRMVTVSLSNN